ncbi:acriflavin resistance protein [Verrucomicrobiaceae bacterium SCGC AG-212-N21]|nr:acriflavin resistance protein [Verrucomicrobiaceae bacterium SCGC AG-212-N21]
MLKAIVVWSLHMRVLVVALAATLLVAGVRSIKDAPLDVFPEFAPPLVEIQTEAPGLSTEEVDALVTVPLENALNGLPFLKTIRSKSVLGLSSVVMIFQEGADLLRARQLVQERLNLAQGRLPAVVRPPVLMAPYSSLSRVLKVGMSSKSLSQMELSELALWTVRPRIMSVPGVANVAIWGQRDKEYQVLVDPERLRTAGVSLDQVVKAAGDAAIVGAGGFMDTPNQRLAVRQVGSVTSADDLSRSIVAFRNGTPLRLGDVAQVVIGHPAPIGDGVINDGPGILLIVEKQPWGNTLDVTHGVERMLAELRPGLAGVDMDSTIFRPATFIELSIDNLMHAMWLGCGLVIVVLVLFLNDWRTALISLTAIPLSIVAAALALHWNGQTINTMVLAGLVIALGEVVDDAIIDVENILRRLRLNRESENPKPAFSIVLGASLEVRSAVVYASLIVVLVFLPVFFLDGLAGTFFRPLAMSYILAILASLVVALTLTPALCLMLLRNTAGRKREGLLVRVLKGIYTAVLPRLLPHAWGACVVLVLAFFGTWVVWKKLGEEFLPNFKERDFLMHWVEKPGTSVEAMTRITIAASKELRSVDGVRNMGAHIGRAEVADEVVGPNFTELWISVDPRVDYAATVAKLQSIVDGYPGLYRDLLTYLRERIKEVLTGASASVVVRIFGPELDVLRDKAAEVGALLKDVPGVSALKVEALVLVPQVQVRLRTEAAANFGLSAADVRRAVTTLVKGQQVGEVYEEQKVHRVTVWSVPAVRGDLRSLRELLVETPAGAHVPLGEVADLAIVPAPNEIKREGASRRIDVTCNVSGRDLGSVARDIKAKLAGVGMPRGYHPEILGEYAARESAQQRLLLLSAMALAGIFVLLLADFQSLRLALLVALTLPFALIGGVLAAWFGGGVLSLGSLVGFVTVLGIAARNGIMLVSHLRHLEIEEGEAFGPALVLRGATERLVPILMTAAAAAFALLPLVWRGNIPGHEIEYPMAFVILGGLATSTVLNLFVLPPLYARFGRVKRTGETVLRSDTQALQALR